MQRKCLSPGKPQTLNCFFGTLPSLHSPGGRGRRRRRLGSLLFSGRGEDSGNYESRARKIPIKKERTDGDSACRYGRRRRRRRRRSRRSRNSSSLLLLLRSVYLNSFSSSRPQKYRRICFSSLANLAILPPSNWCSSTRVDSREAQIRLLKCQGREGKGNGATRHLPIC